ncbi:hypothetical protein DP117_01225 [Brasilonema sp. UFV-L1]|uniref:type II toxin-antitoxin system prevent-host-death family antitoxin n=1 Tax=Brasilonema sp. UFV-L1 TaxID=2234130 RepID=UPI00145E493E|nr:hypothetical protein [Brasilonema sp. UFV-L1]
MQEISLAEASKNLSQLIEAAMNGEEVVITKDNQPVVKLTPVSPVKKRRPAKAGSAKGLITISDDFDEPLEDFNEFGVIPHPPVRWARLRGQSRGFNAPLIDNLRTNSRSTSV